MKKSVIRWAIILATVLVAYHVVVFALPISKGSVFWVSYVFTLLAMTAQAYIIRTAFYRGEGIQSKFYGFPIAKIGAAYLVFQLVLGLIFMAMGAFIPIWIPLVAYAILLCVVVIGLVAADATRDEVERQEVQIKKNTSTMRELQMKTDSMVSLIKDEDVSSALHKLAEEFRFSDPVSLAPLEEIETTLNTEVNKLQILITSKSKEEVLAQVEVVSQALIERNRLCKLRK